MKLLSIYWSTIVTWRFAYNRCRRQPQARCSHKIFALPAVPQSSTFFTVPQAAAGCRGQSVHIRNKLPAAYRSSSAGGSRRHVTAICEPGFIYAFSTCSLIIMHLLPCVLCLPISNCLVALCFQCTFIHFVFMPKCIKTPIFPFLISRRWGKLVVPNCTDGFISIKALPTYMNMSTIWRWKITCNADCSLWFGHFSCSSPFLRPIFSPLRLRITRGGTRE